MDEQEVEEAISILCDEEEPQPPSNLEKFGCSCIIFFLLVFWVVVILGFIGAYSE